MGKDKPECEAILMIVNRQSESTTVGYIRSDLDSIDETDKLIEVLLSFNQDKKIREKFNAYDIIKKYEKEKK
jgi:hypothetical protein